MPHPLLDPQIQQFIWDNTGSPLTKLALMKNPFKGIEWAEVINQVAAREKAGDKLPEWFKTKEIIYPSKVSVEQTSSEPAAQFKASIITGENLIDLTGGFGVDSYYFSKQVNFVCHCEMNEDLSAIAAHNFKMLGAENIECLHGDSLNTLNQLERNWDWIYIDPARRNDAKGKVFMLKDCMPNVPELLDIYFEYTKNILVKTAPLLDITAGMSELNSVKEIYIVALNNEVKELLWRLERDYKGEVKTHAVSITKERTDIFTTPLRQHSEALYSEPGKYLYEPNSAIMKSGAFDTVSAIYTIEKLHRHTHLYTSDKLIDFPGRRFVIDETIPYSKTEMKPLEGKKMNITARNFPLTVEDIRKKWKLKEGGDTYAFFTTNTKNEKVVLLCSKV